MTRQSNEDTAYFEQQAYEQGRREALEEAAQVVEGTEVEGYEDRERPTQVCHDNGEATLRKAAAAVRALADAPGKESK